VPTKILHFAVRRRCFCTYRKISGNGTLHFPPFLAQYYRTDVHEATYRCRASNEAGTVLSRNVQVQAGECNVLWYSAMA